MLTTAERPVDVAAYMVGIGTLIGGAAAAGALLVRRGESDHDTDKLITYLKTQLDECEQRERARTRPARKRRQP